MVPIATIITTTTMSFVVSSFRNIVLHTELVPTSTKLRLPITLLPYFMNFL